MTNDTISTFVNQINATSTSFGSDVSYDNHGAILYTTITLLFYSLSLFCSLILNIDPTDRYYEQKWADFQQSAGEKKRHESQTNILTSLSDQNLRARYWRIYYGDDELSSRPCSFPSKEMKRLSRVSKRIHELSLEQHKEHRARRELVELDHLYLGNSFSPSSPTLSAPILSRFRKNRSTSVPGPYLLENPTHRSFNVLCVTPLCKPPMITVTDYSKRKSSAE